MSFQNNDPDWRLEIRRFAWVLYPRLPRQAGGAGIRHQRLKESFIHYLPASNWGCDIHSLCEQASWSEAERVIHSLPACIQLRMWHSFTIRASIMIRGWKSHSFTTYLHPTEDVTFIHFQQASSLEAEIINNSLPAAIIRGWYSHALSTSIPY